MKKVDYKALGLDEKTAKAFGGCVHCYGKGYSTSSHAGIVTCICARGVQMEANLRQADRDLLQYMKKLLPNFIDMKFPKGAKKRGDATVAIAFFISWINKQL